MRVQPSQLASTTHSSKWKNQDCPLAKIDPFSPAVSLFLWSEVGTSQPHAMLDRCALPLDAVRPMARGLDVSSGTGVGVVMHNSPVPDPQVNVVIIPSSITCGLLQCPEWLQATVSCFCYPSFIPTSRGKKGCSWLDTPSGMVPRTKYSLTLLSYTNPTGKQRQTDNTGYVDQESASIQNMPCWIRLVFIEPSIQQPTKCIWNLTTGS